MVLITGGMGFIGLHTARAFLDPIRSRPNLRIETDAYATRVLLEGKKAVGVEFRQGFRCEL